MISKIFLFVIYLLLSLNGTAQSYQKRLALVVGNGEYQHGGKLPNPVNDVRAMAISLRSLGFEVMKFENVTQTQLKQAINSFGLKLKDFEVGLFYYAGHGIQNKGRNYMIPVEADLLAEEQVEFDCVAADRVLAFMEAASTKVNMIIMDACRNNPFERSWHRSGAGNGLAVMDAPTGTLIAYATAPGKVASDGASSNGLYTSSLLKYMNDPALNIEQVFKKVRTEVTEKSLGAQVPWETTSLTGDDFFLNTKKISSTNQTQANKPAGNGNSGEVSRTFETEADETKATEYYTLASKKYDEFLYEEAMAGYSEAIKFNPLYTLAYLWRGHSKYALKMYEESVHDYNKVIQLSPGDAEAYYYRGSAKYVMLKDNEAITDFTFTLKYEPRHAKAFYYRGLCYYNLNKAGAALADFDEAIALAPDAITYYWRANSLLLLKEYTRALADFNKALELNSKHADSYFWRAHAFENLKQQANAKNDVTKAISLDPDNKLYSEYMKKLNE